MTIFKKKFLFIVLTTLLWACGNDGGDPSTEDNSKDRKEILLHWADNIIIPSYEIFKTKIDDLNVKVQSFTTSPNQTSLSEIRTAWEQAYVEWQNVELFEFGPADRYTLRNMFNIYPTDIAGINSNINNPSANLEVPSAYPTQGFPAIDYLLFGVGSTNEEVIAFYTTHPDAQKNADYLKKLTDRMSTLTTNVLNEWKTSYRETFISNTGLDIGSSFGIVVNAYVLQYERYVRSGKIGIPSGAMTGTTTTIFPEKVEAYYKKDLSLALAKAAHEAASGFFNGAHATTGVEGLSFKTYLDALEAKDDATGSMLSEIINEQFAATDTELNKLSDDFSSQVQSDNQAMLDTFAAMQKLVRLLKLDMTSAMSITITYTDNDGD